MVNPGMSGVTMNALIPRGPRRSSAPSVRAMARITVPGDPLETHALVPFRTQWSPWRTACVRSDAASEPASGSDSANAPSNSPRAIGRRYFCFCCSVPQRRIIWVGRELWTLIVTAAEQLAAGHRPEVFLLLLFGPPTQDHLGGEGVVDAHRDRRRATRRGPSAGGISASAVRSPNAGSSGWG